MRRSLHPDAFLTVTTSVQKQRSKARHFQGQEGEEQKVAWTGRLRDGAQEIESTLGRGWSSNPPVCQVLRPAQRKFLSQPEKWLKGSKHFSLTSIFREPLFVILWRQNLEWGLSFALEVTCWGCGRCQHRNRALFSSSLLHYRKWTC